MGKTVAASFLAQRLREASRNVTIIDADPSKESLVKFSALDAERLFFLDKNDEFDTDTMDRFVQEIMDSDSDFILDFGAAGFPHIASFLKRDDVIDIIAESGKNVCVHTFVVGGERQDQTVKLARAFLEQMPSEIQLVLWINPAFGRLKHEDAFTAWFAGRGVHIIRIPDVHPRSTGSLAYVLENKLTFAEAAEDDSIPFLGKRRLATFWNELSTNIAKATGCGE